MAATFDSEFFAAASPQLDELFGEAVAISRGSSSTAGVTASWSSNVGTIETAKGISTQLIDRAWLIAKADYKIGGVAVEPRAGDRLTDSDGHVWEVLPSVAGPAAVSFGGGLEWEVKTKKVV